ncbi:dorsal-ventral patterning protein tolloid [Anastrepha obliqua]|uniref:dorsal-ventral patterning protein tolloid n=1 Tax=Anastrepha obliqua TaxID=95512 RepID=UPI002409F263|nr:dorsal-ventral patterning protein tolloid [Anastrepha obliqua]
MLHVRQCLLFIFLSTLTVVVVSSGAQKTPIREQGNHSQLTRQQKIALTFAGLQVESEGSDTVELPKLFGAIDTQIVPDTKDTHGAIKPKRLKKKRKIPGTKERNITADAALSEGEQNNAIRSNDTSGNSRQRKQSLAFPRRLFKQLKGQRIPIGKKKNKRPTASSTRKPSKSRHNNNNNNKKSNRNHKSKTHSFHHHQNMNDTTRLARAVTANKERIWDHGVIPYTIANNFDTEHKALFIKGMRHWENFTCIKFVERQPKVHPNYIHFTVKNCGCCSFVGKRGTGRQIVSIGRNCETFGIVVHELGHAIGFWHEHTRIDRDQYIKIINENIMKGQESNFNKLSPVEVDSLGLPYDYNSIMHYSKNTFAKNGYVETIQPIGLSKTQQNEIGQRLHISDGDILKVNLLYKCSSCGRTYQENSGQIDSPHYKYSQAAVQASNVVDEGGSGDSEVSDFDKSLEKCEWRITATNGERIVLQIHEVHLLESTNCSVDYLEIRDGYWNKSPVIKRLCGNVTAETVESNSSRILINYVNQNANKGFRGFSAEYQVTCGGEVFITQDRRIDSPNYPLEYPPDRECIWHISVEENYQVAVRFLSFDLEHRENCLYDYLEIRDGNSSDSQLIGVYCGNTLPSTIKTNSNQMYVKFVSDGTLQKIGFSAIFLKEVDECKTFKHDCEQECINTLGSYQCDCFVGYELLSDRRSCEDTCGGIIDASIPNATVYSPAYPDVYPISKECVWEVVAPLNHTVFLNFTHFDLEGGKYQFVDCNYDYLLAYSKLGNNRLNKLGIYCGQNMPSALQSEQNVMRLEFASDKSIQHTGFSADIHIDLDECSINNGGCQQHCTNTYGSYMCSCRNGYTLHNDEHNCTETQCKFDIGTENGTIYSPNYPNDYPKSTYCFWHFHTILGHRMKLIFHEFEMENHQECYYDNVTLFDGESEKSSILGTYCGEMEPYAVVSTTTDMFMEMWTDGTIQKKGFVATYQSVCGGFLRATNETQVFFSHHRFGFQPYNNLMRCSWVIQADPESSVEIQFLHFDVEFCGSCICDSVVIKEEIFQEKYMRNSNRGTYCGDKKPPTITSYTDTLLIYFKSDGDRSFNGFAVSFKTVGAHDYELVDEIDEATPFPGYMRSKFLPSSPDSDDFVDSDNGEDGGDADAYNY